MAIKKKTPAIWYLRTSSAANVGSDEDSDRRQREAIAAFAGRGGYELLRVRPSTRSPTTSRQSRGAPSRQQLTFDREPSKFAMCTGG
jgi:hypothetical protein